MINHSLRARTRPAPADPTLEQRVAIPVRLMSTTGARLRSTPTTSVPNSALTTKNPTVHTCPGPGHNAWMMTSSALVLFMTLPGLFLFYGGLVRRKNVLSVIAQCFGIAGLVTILWVVFGYSLVFADGRTRQGIVGNLKFRYA